jgi:environmental stress-induced protein Ves
VRILRRADYRAIRWKNGRGIAYQIAACPPDAGYDEFDWQVSRPEITEDGPFSSFPGLDRQFMLVAGSGVTLRLRSEADGVALDRRIDRALEPFAFRGDWDTGCFLIDGPVQVFNVMTRRGRAGARLEIASPDAVRPLAKPAGETLVVYVASGAVEAWGGWGKSTLAADDSILVDEDGKTEVAVASSGAGPARLVLVRLHRAVVAG